MYPLVPDFKISETSKFVKAIHNLSSLKRIRKIGMGIILMLALAVVLHLLFPLPPQPDWSTIITDNQGHVVHAYLTRDEKWRMKTELSEISPLLQKAIIEKEDRYFYYHPGVNPVAVFRAGWNNVIKGRRTSGASTITMQVARALEPGSRTWLHKIREAFRALQLEWKYSKEEILQLYLNLLPYGGNIEGVKSASVLYFRKNPDHLSLAEILALSVIPNRPNSLVMGKHNDRIVEERNKWLERFRRAGVFSEAEIRDALDEPLTARRLAAPQLIPHLSNRLKKSGSNIIHTHIDINTQMKAEKLAEDYIRPLRYQGIHQAAVIVLDNRTGQVISYLGSANFRDTTDGGQVNGAKAIRQPGSTLKPLVYGLAIDGGLLTPKTILMDVATNYDGYAPENFDRQFNGPVSMEYALDHSLNIPAVRTLARIGKDALIEALAGIGFEQIRRDRKKLGLSMALGGCGTNLEEMVGLYSSFARAGVYRAPSFHEADTNKIAKRVLSAPAAFMINQVLSKVNRPDFPLSWQSTEKMPKIAWKTGTSYGRRDAWSIGYNQNYTIGVWVGNFSGVGAAGLSGAETATPLLFRLFNTIDYDADKDWFSQPEECGIRKVCSETGLPPGDYCESTISDYFIPLVSANRNCEHSREIPVSADGKYSYCMQCLPASGYKKERYRLLDAALLRWMDERKIAYRKIPPHNPDCEQVFRAGAPAILSPRNGAEYLLERKNPEPLMLQCQAATDVVRVHWYINDRYYKSAAATERIFFIPESGPVKISCTDDKGRNRTIRINVAYFGQ